MNIKQKCKLEWGSKNCIIGEHRLTFLFYVKLIKPKQLKAMSNSTPQINPVQLALKDAELKGVLPKIWTLCN